MTVRFRPGLCSVTFRALSPEAVIELCARAGLRGIEWGGDVHVPLGDVAAARAVRAATLQAGLEVVAYGSYIRPPADGLEACDAAIATARALGAPAMRIWPGSRGKPSARYGEAERAATAALIRAMAARAQDEGIAIALEYHPDTLTDTLASAAALVRDARHPNLFLYWQPRPGLELAEARSELHQLGAEIAHLHVFHWDGAKRRFPLADAAGFWRGAIEAVATSRWQGDRYALLEFVPGDDPLVLAQEARALSDLLGSWNPTPLGRA